MINKYQHIFTTTLKEMLAEQAIGKVTDNASSDSADSPFTPAEEKFLGKFDAYGTRHLGIIYSPSDIGIREFITRSGSDLNLTPEILLSLIRQDVVKIVPYTGFGQNDDYTIELQLSLNDVKGLGAEDEKAAETAKGGGAAAGGMPPEPAAPGPELAWVVKYGDVLTESALIAKRLISEKNTKKKTSKNKDIEINYEIYVDQSRMLKRLPVGFVNQLKKIIGMLDKETKNIGEKERLVADILDNLQVNFNLDLKHITTSYNFYRDQKRLQKYIDKNKSIV